MKRAKKRAPANSEARVMLFEGGGDAHDILHGQWHTNPWGMGTDFCYAINLESGQALHIWLERVTDQSIDGTSLLSVKNGRLRQRHL